MKGNVYFVSGIDTDIGKSYATGYIARTWNGQGVRTITQKLIQTGNDGISEDIVLHRRIMDTGLLPEDREGLTMPEIYSYPCSPHLAAEIDGRPIDFCKIEKALGLEAVRHRGIRLHTVAYNLYPHEDDDRISRDTEDYIRSLLSRDWPDTRLITVPIL